MLNTWPLHTDAKWNLGNRVLGEVEKNSFIVLPGKGGEGNLVRSGQLIRIRVCAGPVSSGLRRSPDEFYGSRCYQTMTFSLE